MTPPIIFGTGTPIGTGSTEREVITLPVRDVMHSHVIGKSSFGKSRFLCSLFLVLMHRGISCTLIDPAGDASRLILQYLISLGYFSAHTDAFSRVIYLDIPGAYKRDLYVPFNILDTGHDPYVTADVVLEAFMRYWSSLKSGTAANIETLVKMCSFLLAANSLPLFPFMYYILTDSAFRQHLLSTISDALVLQYFAHFTNRNGELAINSDATVKRIFLLAFTKLFRYSLGQMDNPVFNFRTNIDSNRSLIINLNVQDPDVMRLYGCFLTVAAEFGAKSRGDIPAEQRKGTHMLFLDECQNFVAQSDEALGHILEECRKFGLFLCLSHQNWQQIPTSLRAALQNCAIEAVFRLERPDAEISAPLLGFAYDPYAIKFDPLRPHAPPRAYSMTEQEKLNMLAITQLAKREAFLKLPGDRLYKLQSLTVSDPVVSATELEAIEAEYRRLYFRSRHAIDAAQARQLSTLQAVAPEGARHQPLTVEAQVGGAPRKRML
jgi:hypothetical protein